MKTINNLLACPALALFSVAAAAQGAAANQVTLNIEPQPMLAALNGWAEQTGLQIVVMDNAGTHGLVTQGLKGTFTAGAALAELLSGTSLTYEFVSDRIVVVRPGANRPAVRKTAMTAAAEPTRATPARARQRQNTIEEEDRPVETVIVTAQKRSERLIDTPVSVTAMTSDSLEKLGATQFRDFADMVPGLSFQSTGPGYTQISMRGVTVGQDAGATVGIYVDEVPYGSSTSYARGGQVTLDVGLFDLNRVEVLRGPQGTLYGASSMGGVIKYITKQPDASRFGMDVQTGVSSTHEGGVGYNGAVAVNAPLVDDKAALRVSTFYSHDGGYVDNVTRRDKDVNESDVYGGRADLLLTPTDTLDVRISAFAQEIDRGGAAYADYRLTGQPVDGSLAQRRVFAEPFDQSFRLISGTVTYDAGPLTVTSVSSYQSTETNFWLDNTISFAASARASGQPTTVATGIDDHSSTDKFTQELRLTSKSSNTFEWLLGGFFTNEESEFTQALTMLNAAGEVLPNNVFTFATPTIYEEVAAFGDVTVYLTPKLDVTAGVRYAKNRNRFEQIGTGTLGRTSPRFYADDDVFTYLGNVRYRFTDHATGYLRYATGYRPGGPNVVSLATDRSTFDADTLKNYEIGFKAETEDRRFSGEIAAYYIDWNDIIVTFTQSGFAAKTNVPGGAEIKGGELSLGARPIDGLSITAGVGYQNATLTEANIRLRARAGERLPTVPRYNANLSVDWELPWSNLQPVVGTTARFVGERYASYDASTSIPQYELPSYAMVDIRAGVTLGSVFTQFYVRNLFDERAQLMPRLTSPLSGPMLLSISQPRTLGVTATVKF